MKIIKDLLNKSRPQFSKGGRYQRFYPLFEALESFLFSRADVTAAAPHVRDGMDMKRVMITVVIALIPCVIMAMWNTGYQANLVLAKLGVLPVGWRGSILALTGYSPASHLANILHGALYFLPVLIVSLTVGGIWETIFNVVRGHEMSESFLVTAFLFALSLPPSIPLWQAGIGISFGVVFAKAAFGGTGRNFMNPALAARAFIFFAYPAHMSGDGVWTVVDGVSSATALSKLAAAGSGSAARILDMSWGQAFLGVMPGSFGETSTLACLLGAALLLVTGIASWRIMAAVLTGGLICSLLFLFFDTSGPAIAGVPPHWHLVLGGFAFGLVFMATDPVSAAHTPVGQWCYGMFIGMLAILIRVANPAFPEGTMLAILLGNVFAPLFDYFVVEANIKRRRARYGT